MDPDQTAPTGAVLSGSTLFVYEASNMSVDDKNIHFVSILNMSLVCIRLKPRSHEIARSPNRAIGHESRRCKTCRDY